MRLLLILRFRMLPSAGQKGKPQKCDALEVKPKNQNQTDKYM